MSPLLIEGPECGHCWRTGDGITHRCIAIPGHKQACSCFCGVCQDQTPAASLPPDAPGQGAPSG